MQEKEHYYGKIHNARPNCLENREDRKPLILLGARQVGKTYILKEFGQREFENIAYINCDNNAMVKDLLAHPINLGGTAKTCPLTDTHRFPMIILSHIKHKPR